MNKGDLSRALERLSRLKAYLAALPNAAIAILATDGSHHDECHQTHQPDRQQINFEQVDHSISAFLHQMLIHFDKAAR
jgi:hypothetical protein